MQHLYLAWKHGGHDPYALHNGLLPDFTDPATGERRPPPFSHRHRQLLFAFARRAEEEQQQRAAAGAGA